MFTANNQRKEDRKKNGIKTVKVIKEENNP